MDAAELAQLAGERMLLFSLPARSADIPVRGQLKRIEGVVFRGGAVVVPVPAARVRALLTDYANYTQLFPRTASATVLQGTAAQAIVEYVHAFQFSIMTLHTRITLQHTREPDGSLSAWLMEGDVSAAVSRWQVIELDAKRSLVVYLNWADMASSNIVLQALMKAQPELTVAAPYGAAFVALDAVRLALHPVPAPQPADELPQDPAIARFPQADAHPLLRTLTDAGPLLLIDFGQWLNRDGEACLQRFVAVGHSVALPVQTAFRRATQFERYPEFMPLISRAIRRSKTEPPVIDWHADIRLGFFAIGVHYRLAYQPAGATTLAFRAEGGDVSNIDGHWDWQALDDGNCLGSVTIGYRFGNNPPLVLRVLRNLPHHDVLAGIYMGLTGMMRLRAWLPAQTDGRSE